MGPEDEYEDEMARIAERHRRDEAQDRLDALNLDFEAFATCPSGTEYVHKPGVFCPACGVAG